MPKSETRPWAAALSMLAAMLVIGYIDNTVQIISQSVGLWQFLAVRASISVPLIVLTGWLAGQVLWPRNWQAVAVRSLWVTLAMLIYFGSLAVMPIQEALAGLFTSPVFILLLTVALYGERVGPWRIAAVLIGFAGVLVVLSPEGGTRGWAGLVAVLSGLFYALGALATRRSCANEGTFALLIGVMVCQAVVACVALGALAFIGPGESFLTRGWTWGIGHAGGYILLQAVGSAIGVGLIIRAYQLGDTTHVAIYEYSVFIFGPFFGWLLFAQAVTVSQGIGIALIALAGALITLRSR